MWRSLFTAIGIMLIVLGAECLFVDSASVFASQETASFVDPTSPPVTITKTVRPTEGLPWMLMAVGAITVLYSVTIQGKSSEGA